MQVAITQEERLLLQSLMKIIYFKIISTHSTENMWRKREPGASYAIVNKGNDSTWRRKKEVKCAEVGDRQTLIS